MNILIATDSFKGSLPAVAVCAALARGLEAAGHHCEQLPLADGGEGSLRALTTALGGHFEEATVRDPLGRPHTARFGISADGQAAVVEMAEASGLEQLAAAERNPLQTTTYGTGELILAALRRGVQRIYLCLGGSATHDLGMGMASALGYRFYDVAGQTLAGIGYNLGQVAQIDDFRLFVDPKEFELIALTDVTNPLIGSARVYAPQKGADEATVARLEAGTKHLAGLLEQHFHLSLTDLEGGGAAGGMGAGAVAFLGGRLLPGAATLLDLIGFKTAAREVDLVLTGEGALDQQTLHGKLIQSVCNQAHAVQTPVVACCGKLDLPKEALEALGLTAAFSISHGPELLTTALKNTEQYLESFGFNLGKFLSVC